MVMFSKNENEIKFFGFTLWEKPKAEIPVVDVNDFGAYTGQNSYSGAENSVYDGEKFLGGYGLTQLLDVDYFTLRQRSSELFTNNLYARGIVRRLVTNEINTGLSPEATPDEKILGLKEGSLNEWSENAESRFHIWGKNPLLCDYKQSKTFGAIQRDVRMEALIDGDILCILRQNKKTKLPQIQLVNGGKVRTPVGDYKLKNNHKTKHGIETNKKGIVVAHWILQDDFTYKRIAAVGEKSGRRISWLVYGTDKRHDDLRGQPLLSIVLQSLKEIDRYRDSTQRKAVINSILAMFIKKTEDKPGTLPFTGGAVKHGTVKTTSDEGTPRKFNMAGQIPGLVIEELQHGEEPILKGGEGTDLNFGVFEEAIIQAVAWCLEIPPEILRLTFSNNYSASQAAINEFKIAINRTWGDFGESVCTPIYNEWLLSEVLLRKIKAPGLLEAWRNPDQYDVFGAWTLTEWYGSIKPSTDMLKQTKGSKMLVDEGWSTNAREARVTTGTKFSTNIKRLKRENELKVEAMRPIAEFKKEFGEEKSKEAIEALETATIELIEVADAVND